jgi:hypothetical protein
MDGSRAGCTDAMIEHPDGRLTRPALDGHELVEAADERLGVGTEVGRPGKCGHRGRMRDHGSTVRPRAGDRIRADPQTFP